MFLSEPLKLQSQFVPKIWGGRGLEQFTTHDMPSGTIGEYWAVSTHPKGPSSILCGRYEGERLPELIRRFPAEIMGRYIVEKGFTEEFPLLIKLIDAHDRLSVQVHPDDEYAGARENGFGKTEVWYILKAEPGSKILYGLKAGADIDTLKQSVATGKVPELLRYVDIKDGDVLFVPPGVVHTILDGILLLEIGESSESNYRLYDWDRIDTQGNKRELHLEKAYDVIDFGFRGEPQHPEPTEKEFGYFTELKTCSHFSVEKFLLHGKTENLYTEERFHILICLSGEATIHTGNKSLNFTRGEPILVPANLKSYSLAPSSDTAEVIRIYVP